LQAELIEAFSGKVGTGFPSENATDKISRRPILRHNLLARTPTLEAADPV
jgi:hypothetical protein